MRNGKRISGTVTHTVDVGSPLTITDTGIIAPTRYGAAGVQVAPGVQNAVILNRGQISGAFSGNDVGNGGIGVDLQAATTLSNDGTIAGGAVRREYYQTNYHGGAGILLAAGGSVTNRGDIVGGGSPVRFSNDAMGGSVGGDGVDVIAGGVIINHGAITGGYGGYSVNSGGTGDTGGISDTGGTGVLFDLGGTLSNAGTISGGETGKWGMSGYGKPGGTGVDLANGGTIFNAGAILGGQGAYNGGQGGIGVQVDAGSLSNNGTIVGGTGGVGLNLESDGGSAVDLSNGAAAINHGAIYGGTGSYSFSYGGNGGAGVDIQNATLSAFGTIVGGTGGISGDGSNGGYGGAGVVIDGGELIAQGTIIGGTPVQDNDRTVPAGDAVSFGSVAGTLLIDPSARFSGDIVANPTANDVLALGGETTGTLTGLGTNVTGFTTITEDANAHWLVTGTVSGEGSLTIGTDARLELQGTVSIAAIVFAAGGGETLNFANPQSVSSTFSGFAAGDDIHLSGIEATSLAFRAGTLTLFDASHTAIDTLQLSGDYNAGDFTLRDQYGNTDILFAGQAPHVPDTFGTNGAERSALRTAGTGFPLMLWHVPAHPG